MSPAGWILILVAFCVAAVIWTTMGQRKGTPKNDPEFLQRVVEIDVPPPRSMEAGALIPKSNFDAFEVMRIPPPVPIAESLNVAAFIGAFADAEGWQGRPGPKGEQGIWQWTEPTWRRYSSRPFLWAALRTPEAILEQRATAVRQLAEVMAQYHAESIDPTITDLALAIGAGFEGATRGFPDPKKHAQAMRVANLYWLEIERKGMKP